MLGRSIEDPEGVENAGRGRDATGLGLLPVRTVLRAEKTVRRVRGETGWWDAPPFHGYEIHMGKTFYEACGAAFSRIRREGEGESVQDGAVSPSGQIWGTYVHGIFDDDGFRHAFIRAARRECCLRRGSSARR